MTFRKFPSEKTSCPSTYVRVAGRGLVLLNVLLSTHAGAFSEPAWREVALDFALEASVGSERESLLPVGKGVMAAFDDLTQCRVGKNTDVSGVIAMSDAGLAGPFLAIWWDSNGRLSATLRSAASVAEESFSLRDGGQSELILVRRGARIYAYTVESGRTDPLIAVDFPIGINLNAGALVGNQFSGRLPAISKVVSSSTLTGNVMQKQPGARFTGNWSTEENPGSLGGSHLVGSGDDEEASATVTLENLQPGAHELWIRHAAAQSRSEEVEVTVEGFGKSLSLVVNQRISGGIWLALGLFDTDSVTAATIGLKSARPGSGSISLDGVHEVWVAKTSDDHDQMTGVVETASDLNSFANGGGIDRIGKDPSSLDEFSISPASLVDDDQGTPADDDKAVFFVHSSLGNDSYDGHMEKPQAGAWYSVRGGPKRSIEAALRSVSKSTKVIELHLDGRLESPAGGFQNLGALNVVLVPGVNGTSLEASSLDSCCPVLPPPPIPRRP